MNELEVKIQDSVGEFIRYNSFLLGIYYTRKFVEGLEEFLLSNGIYDREHIQKISRIDLVAPPMPYLSFKGQDIGKMATEEGRAFMGIALTTFIKKPGEKLELPAYKEKIEFVYQRIVLQIRLLLLKKNREVLGDINLSYYGGFRKNEEMMPAYKDPPISTLLS